MIRCLYQPDLIVRTDLSAVAEDGGQLVIPAADLTTATVRGVAHTRAPAAGQHVVLQDSGLSKTAVIREIRPDGSIIVDVAGNRLHHFGH